MSNSDGVKSTSVYSHNDDSGEGDTNLHLKSENGALCGDHVSWDRSDFVKDVEGGDEDSVGEGYSHRFSGGINESGEDGCVGDEEQSV